MKNTPAARYSNRMITDTEFKYLSGIPDGRPGLIVDKEKSYVYNKWLVLELNTNEIDITGTPSDRVMADVRQWRYTQLPDGDGENAVIFRANWGDEVVFKLSTGTSETYVKPEVYEVLRMIFDNLGFKLYKSNDENIAVYNGNKLVGALAPYIPDEQQALTVSD